MYALVLFCMFPLFRASQLKKLGVYDYFIDESSPLIYNNRLLMFESVVRASPSWAGNWLPSFSKCDSYYRVRDMRTLLVLVNITSTCNHAFGAATVFTDVSGRDTILITGTPWDRTISPSRLTWSGPCSGSATSCSVDMFWSSSLGLEDATWASRAPGVSLAGVGVYNNDVMRVPSSMDSSFVWAMALETTSERARFAVSMDADPRNVSAWALLPPNATVPSLPDTGSCPSLRSDGTHFYYLTGGMDISILRSKDLVVWEAAQRKVLLHGDPGDCIIAPAWFGPYLPSEEAQKRLSDCGVTGNFGDDSDVDLVEWPSSFGDGSVATLIQYGSGDQRTFGFSNLALFNGTMNSFLQSFF